MYVGDPQIGASVGQDSNTKEYHAMNDAYNWQGTLNSALSAHTDISFILSAGDQINQTKVTKEEDKLEQQIEYAGFLYPSQLRSTPIATTIGNHDSKSVNYQNHFNTPNAAVKAENTEGATKVLIPTITTAQRMKMLLKKQLRTIRMPSGECLCSTRISTVQDMTTQILTVWF